jgi:hypothetical protein
LRRERPGIAGNDAAKGRGAWSKVEKKRYPETGFAGFYDTIPGSVENAEDLARAGGSGSAGWGRYEFAEDGLLYRMKDRKVCWRVLPGTATPVFGRKEYELSAKHKYQVVVPPNQEWVALALWSQDGKSIELWVGRLRYRD